MACVVYRTDLEPGRPYPLAELYNVSPEHDPGQRVELTAVDHEGRALAQPPPYPIGYVCRRCRHVYVPEER